MIDGVQLKSPVLSNPWRNSRKNWTPWSALLAIRIPTMNISLSQFPHFVFRVAYLMSRLSIIIHCKSHVLSVDMLIHPLFVIGAYLTLNVKKRINGFRIELNTRFGNCRGRCSCISSSFTTHVIEWINSEKWQYSK